MFTFTSIFDLFTRSRQKKAHIYLSRECVLFLNEIRLRQMMKDTLNVECKKDHINNSQAPTQTEEGRVQIPLLAFRFHRLQ